MLSALTLSPDNEVRKLIMVTGRYSSARRAAAFAILALGAFSGPALADPESQTRHHALSLIDAPKYPADFKNFDWVNPDAPKGGAVRMIAFGTFDNFNDVVAGLKGSLAAGAGMISDTLMAGSLVARLTRYWR